MTKLNILRQQLTSLRLRRQAVRWTTAWTALVTAGFWTLAAMFLLDVLFEMDVLQRVVVSLTGIGVLVWAYTRYTTPFLGIQESVLDMALLVERQQEIDSDLIAAIQFESPEAVQWGAVSLEKAVISYVAQLGTGLNVFEGFPYGRFVRRNLVLAVTLLAVVCTVVIFPAYSQVFFNRLLLGSDHYPTDTIITSFQINGTTIDLTSKETQVVNVGFGKGVRFDVICKGEVPAIGRIELKSNISGVKSPITLEPEDPDVDPDAGPALFHGELPRLLENVEYQLYIGDAWTDPRRINVISLPVVKPKLRAIPPEYARSSADAPELEVETLQLSVIEGSAIEVAIESSKPLKRALLTVNPKENPVAIPLTRVDGDTERWILAAQDTPFALVTQPIRFNIQVTDEDNLQLETPMGGYIRLKVDRRPRVSVELAYRVCMPKGKPVIEVEARDDFGIGKLSLVVQIDHWSKPTDTLAGISTGETEGVTSVVEQHIIDITSLLEPRKINGNGENGQPDEEIRKSVPIEFPIRRPQLPLKGGFQLDLSQYNLSMGDQLKLTLNVVDDRGSLEGRSSPSESVVLEISDQIGVLVDVLEADQSSEQRLTDTIKIQTGIGESP